MTTYLYYTDAFGFCQDILEASNKMVVQIATFCGQQGRIPRTVRAILSGQF